MKYSKYSAVIIGSGIAGLYLALKLNAQKSLNDGILILTKSSLNESNSRFAQGGMVAVLDENVKDSISLHVSDTIRSGCGLTDFNVANFISQNSSHVVQDLLNIGVKFDKEQDGKFCFGLEGAHSIPRILHAGKDATGATLERTLCENVLKSDDIDIYEQTMAVELLIDKNKDCKGVLAFNSETKSYEAIYSNAVILASGGIGQVYKYTTNPPVTTGDGVAIAHHAGAIIENMEFIQFHPTALDCANDLNMSLVSEAVRGEGAKLVNESGEYFMQKYDDRAELAPRDIVTRAIFDEKSKIMLDIAPIGLEKFKKRFPSITKICEEKQVDISSGFIPVSPAAHYCMGGVKTKINGETSIKNLYAIGEVACTGLHGANRLASNSLLECVVCAYELSNTLSFLNLDAPKKIDDDVKKIIDFYDNSDVCEISNARILISKIKDIMWENVGVIRDEAGLLNAKLELLDIKKSFQNNRKCENRSEYELRNILDVALIIADSAIKRKKSIGAHFRSDYKVQDKANEKKVESVKNDGIFVK